MKRFRDAKGCFRRGSPEELAAAFIQRKLDAIEEISRTDINIFDLLDEMSPFNKKKSLKDIKIPMTKEQRKVYNKAYERYKKQRQG